MSDLLREVKTLARTLELNGLDEEETVEFLADEFQECSKSLIKAFRVAFQCGVSERSDVNKAAKILVLSIAFGRMSAKTVNKALKAAGKPPLVKREPVPTGTTLELQGSLNEVMTWGKIYTREGPIIQVTFDSKDVKTVGPFLRSLGLTIVDERV